MPHWRFPDFLQDTDAYAKAQCYWQDLWARILRISHVEEPWKAPWMKNPLPDGNPIFTAVCLPLQRGVRIIQEEPRDPDDIDLDWWLDYFGDKRDPDAIRELVIACCPSVENEAEIERLLRQWVQAGELTLESPPAPWNVATVYGPNTRSRALEIFA